MSGNNDHLRIGESVPEFSLRLIVGGSASLNSLLAGKSGAVIVFWSGVCSHCVRYDDYLNQFCDRHPALSVLAIAAREHETVDQIRATLAQRNLRFPVVHDADRAVAHQWLVNQTPRVFLIDGTRRLVYRGAIDNFKYPQDPGYRAYLEEAIRALEADCPVTRSETPSFGCPIESVYYTLPKPYGG